MAYVHTAVTARDVLVPPTEVRPDHRPQARASAPPSSSRAMQEARMRQAEREIALYLTRNGGKFTDEAEREIERRFLANPGR